MSVKAQPSALCGHVATISAFKGFEDNLMAQKITPIEGKFIAQLAIFRVEL